MKPHFAVGQEVSVDDQVEATHVVSHGKGSIANHRWSCCRGRGGLFRKKIHSCHVVNHEWIHTTSVLVEVDPLLVELSVDEAVELEELLEASVVVVLVVLLN